jgi:hypothetical protein
MLGIRRGALRLPGGQRLGAGAQQYVNRVVTYYPAGEARKAAQIRPARTAP